MYGSAVLALVGMGNWVVVSLVSRIILGMILSLVVLFLKKFNWHYIVKVIIISFNALIFNYLLFLTFYFLLSEQTFVFITGLTAINVAIEWPVVILITIFLTSFIKQIKTKKDQSY